MEMCSINNIDYGGFYVRENGDLILARGVPTGEDMEGEYNVTKRRDIRVSANEQVYKVNIKLPEPLPVNINQPEESQNGPRVTETTASQRSN